MHIPAGKVQEQKEAQILQHPPSQTHRQGAIGRGVEKEFLSMLIHGISTCKNATGQIW